MHCCAHSDAEKEGSLKSTPEVTSGMAPRGRRKCTERLLSLPPCSCDLVLQCQRPLLTLTPPLLPHNRQPGLGGILLVRAGWKGLRKGL